MTRTFISDLRMPYEEVTRYFKDGREHIVIKRLPKPLYRWRADVNQEYFIVCFGLEVSSQVDTRSKEDNDWYEVGNYFKDRRSAGAAAEWIHHGLLYIQTKKQLSLDKTIEKLVEARKVIQTKQGNES